MFSTVIHKDHMGAGLSLGWVRGVVFDDRRLSFDWVNVRSDLTVSTVTGATL